MLALFDEFGTIAAEDMLVIYDGNDQDLSDAISTLSSFSLIESDEGHFKLAPFFQHARFRKRFSVDVDEFLVIARGRLLKVVSSYSSEDSLSFSTIDTTIMAALKEGRELPFGLDKSAIVGSHYLRVARSYYNLGEYEFASKFCNLAFDKSSTLSQSATVETLRLLGMSAARTENNTDIAKAKAELGKIATAQAKRHVHFISGFIARWNGDFEVAENEFKAVIATNPTDTHALRELSSLLLIREDFR